MKYESFLLRRAQFLLDEARSSDPRRDLAVTMTLRAISNYLTVGRDGTSRAVKLANRYMSREARRLRSTLTVDEWHNQTTNEHQLELRRVWQTILDQAETITTNEICDILKKYPFITITNDENKGLREPQVKKASTPEERYKLAGIEVVSIDLPED